MAELMTYFNVLDVCSLGPDAFPEDLLESTCSNELMRWRVAVREGTWVTALSAGGCSQFPD